MLSPRAGTILNYIVSQYITNTAPVSSQSIADNSGLMVSSATIRNEVAALDSEGYIIRPHTSAGNIPSDNAYRCYVDSLEETLLPQAEQRLVSHLFHQVEREVERWLSLSATMIAQLVRNVAVVTMPKAADCRFKHLELLSLQDRVVLAVVVLHGARVKEKLIRFDQTVSQTNLTIISNKLNAAYSGLTSRQISAKEIKLSSLEQQVTDYMVEMMQSEDEQKYEEPYLDGLHFTLNQPEFAHSERVRVLMELIEYRSLLKSIIPKNLSQDKVHVIIGKENEAAAMQNFSVVIRQYGLPDEAVGAIGVVGPTRMSYSHTIPTVDYLSSVLSGLVAGLYGKEPPPQKETSK